MSDLQANLNPNERITLRPVVGLAANGEGLEFWLEDEEGQEYEMHGQTSFTYDRDFPKHISQVAVVSFCDEHLNPFKK